MVTDHFTFEKKKCFCVCLKSHFSYCSQFHHLHVNTIAIYKVNKDRMSDCFLDIRIGSFKRTCLVYSKFPTAIEAIVAVCFLTLSFE